MAALEAENFNANQVSVAGGLLPDCAASDDLTSPLGIDANGSVESMLRSAMDFFVFGTCDVPTLLASRTSTSGLDELDVDTRQLPARGGAIAAERPR